MVTPLQKYNGNNLKNNCVIVDYENKTVKFKPVKGLNPLITFFLNIFINYLFVLAILFIILLNLELGESFNYVTRFAFYLVSIIMLLEFLFWGICFMNNNFRKNHYPKVNALLYGKRKIKVSKTINPEAIINNMFILSLFKNVYFEYETTKDYADYLIKIEIVNKFKDKDHDRSEERRVGKECRSGWSQYHEKKKKEKEKIKIIKYMAKSITNEYSTNITTHPALC